MIWAMHNISRLVYKCGESGGTEPPAGSCRPDVSDCGYLWPSLFFFGDSANCLVGQLGSNPTTFNFLPQ